MNSKYFVVRTFSAGVFFGKISWRNESNPKHIVMINARRLWYWAGAASLSQLAMEGVKDPDKCKFPVAVNEVELTEVIEIITATEEAVKSINEVPVWTA